MIGPTSWPTARPPAGPGPGMPDGAWAPSGFQSQALPSAWRRVSACNASLTASLAFLSRCTRSESGALRDSSSRRRSSTHWCFCSRLNNFGVIDTLLFEHCVQSGVRFFWEEELLPCRTVAPELPDAVRHRTMAYPSCQRGPARSLTMGTALEKRKGVLEYPFPERFPSVLLDNVKKHRQTCE